MATGREQSGPSESSSEPTSGYNAVNRDDDLTLRHWFESLAVQDPRYANKFLYKLAAMAMGHDERRWRLVNDTENFVREVRSELNRADGSQSDSLEGVTLRFWDNTPGTLHIVLPPRAGVTSKFPESLRNELYSRTSRPRPRINHFQDDGVNFGDLWNSSDHGDRGHDIADT